MVVRTSTSEKKSFLVNQEKPYRGEIFRQVLRDSWTRDRGGKKDSVRVWQTDDSFWGTEQSRHDSVAWSCHPRSSAQTWESISFWRTWWRNLYRVLILADLVEFSICFRRKHEFAFQTPVCISKIPTTVSLLRKHLFWTWQYFFCWYWFTELNTSKQTFSLKVKNRW